MNKSELTKLIDRLGIAPNKKLGQNFLADDNFLAWIVRYAKIEKGENVLEVGPGLGALTIPLLEAGAKLTAIEFDRKLAAYIRETLTPRGLTLVEGDACRINFPDLFMNQDFRVISNLPYSAGTIIVANLLDLDMPPKDMIVMLQKEVALRFTAKPGTDDYSALTVRLDAVYESGIVRTIPPDLFYPRPEIDSCIIHLKRRENVPSPEFRRVLSRLTKTAFSHRRKKMFKQTTGMFDADALRSAMTQAGVDMDIRAEKVTPEQFRAMTALLMK